MIFFTGKKTYFTKQRLIFNGHKSNVKSKIFIQYLLKIQALLDAAGRNQTLEDILDILPKQVLDIPVHRQPENHVKHPQDIFR